MEEKEINYITFEEFINNSGVKESTIKRKYKQIPGIIKTNKGFKVISGTRYPCDLHRYSLKSSSDKRYVLLKTISMYKYISHTDLKIEYKQFVDMLEELLMAGLIQPNNLSNCYGANAYDCSALGDELLEQKRYTAKAEMIDMIANATGKFVGNIVSNIYNMDGC